MHFNTINGISLCVIHTSKGCDTLCFCVIHSTVIRVRDVAVALYVVAVEFVVLLLLLLNLLLYHWVRSIIFIWWSLIERRGGGVYIYCVVFRCVYLLLLLAALSQDGQRVLFEFIYIFTVPGTEGNYLGISPFNENIHQRTPFLTLHGG